MLYLIPIYYIWVRYLPCYSWHRYLPCYPWPVTSDSGTWYLHRHSIYGPGTWDMTYLTPASDTRYMICFYVVQIPGLDILTLDRTLLPLIPVLYDIFMTITFTGTWHDYYIITRYLVLLNSCTPVFLNPWNREAPDITPDIILLLTPVIW